MFVGRVWGDGYYVPGVEEAGEEAEHCSLVRIREGNTVRGCNLLHKAMLMRESAEQRPRLTHTASGGKRMAIRPRKMSLPHMLLVMRIACVVGFGQAVVQQRIGSGFYGNMGALSVVTGAGDEMHVAEHFLSHAAGKMARGKSKS